VLNSLGEVMARQRGAIQIDARTARRFGAVTPM